MVQKLKRKSIKGGTNMGMLMIGPVPPSFGRRVLMAIGGFFSFIWFLITFITRLVDVGGNIVTIIVLIVSYFILQMVLDAIHATFKPLTKMPFVGKEIKKADKKIAKSVFGLFMMWLEKLGLIPPVPDIGGDEEESPE
jgi:hypothetical protein